MFIRSLRSYLKRRWLIIIFIVFFLSFIFYLAQSIDKKTIMPKSQIISKVSQGLPVRLIIPVINVNADIQRVGVTSKGEMEVPSNAVDVGWFDLGPRPGERGSAVIAGHFDGVSGEAGVFFNLYKLKKGDKLYIKDDKGKQTIFIVREKRLYDPGYANEVFTSSDTAHLNLITCDGLWDGVKKSYSKRLVIFTDKSALDKYYN